MGNTDIVKLLLETKKFDVNEIFILNHKIISCGSKILLFKYSFNIELIYKVQKLLF